MKIILEIEDAGLTQVIFDYLNKSKANQTAEAITAEVATKEESHVMQPPLIGPVDDELVITITPDEMRRAFMAKNSAENRSKLKSILEEFDASNISSLAAEYYPEAMKRLEAI